jgi:hypothetical protein
MYLREVPRPHPDHSSVLFSSYLGQLPRQAPAVAGQRCPRLYTRARNFRELIALVRAAEARLTACGFASSGDRIHVAK